MSNATEIRDQAATSIDQMISAIRAEGVPVSNKQVEFLKENPAFLSMPALRVACRAPSFVKIFEPENNAGGFDIDPDFHQKLVEEMMSLGDDKIDNQNSKKVDGSLFEFIFKNIHDEKYSITVSCEKENLIHTFSFLIYQRITTPTETSSSGACYIATVCYGDDMSLEVIKFREFRDKILKNNNLGRKFIKLYYNYAEDLSNKMTNKKLINNVIKILILNPLYFCIKYYLNYQKK
jgi:hypothetical protein